MRLGLDLEGADRDRAAEADRLGVWAVLVSGPPGTEVVRAAAVATATEHARIAVRLDTAAEHPFTLAEEIAVLDNLSGGRVIVVGPDPDGVLGAALGGERVADSMVAPPPVQPSVPIWDVATGLVLTGDLESDRTVVDRAIASGVTHAFATHPGPLPVFARHLVTRAAMVDFPQIVADVADRIAPVEES